MSKYNLREMTDQQVFNIAAYHLMQQMEKSQIGNASRYFGPNDLKCVAGVFLDPELKNQVEGHAWKVLVSKGLVPNDHAELIHQLQEVHDRAAVAEWNQYLRNLATKFQLSAAVLDVCL